MRGDKRYCTSARDCTRKENELPFHQKNGQMGDGGMDGSGDIFCMRQGRGIGGGERGVKVQQSARQV